MQTLELNLIKKNRVYFKCTNEKGYEVKLKVDEKSQNLELGKQKLLVNDISVRSKYGTDLIYQVYAEIKEEGIVSIKHRYNSLLVEKCRELGGKFDNEAIAWIFSKIVEDKVEELEFLYNHDIVSVEIISKTDIFKGQDAINFLGYPIAKATGRDSGAIVCNDVSMISGKIDSAGSVKNWSTEIRKDSCFRLHISKNLLENLTDVLKEKWDIKIID